MRGVLDKNLKQVYTLAALTKLDYIPYKMNICRQFNLANQSFLSDWQILHW